MNTKKIFLVLIVLIFIIGVINVFYFQPATQLARNQGTVLTDNWFNAFRWIEGNTAECAVVATYWDPGHFIRAIAHRPAVFDGASQNAMHTVTIDGTLTEEEVRNITGTPTFEFEHVTVDGEEKTKITTSRIQDIATALYTSDEDRALSILERYRVPGCDEMYFLATSDLIGKAQWWSYFATWDPVDKGNAQNYFTVPLTNSRPLLQENAIAYTYAMSQQQAFVIFDREGELEAHLQVNNQFNRVEKLFFFTQDGNGRIITDRDAPVKGMVWLTPRRDTMIFIPPALEGSMFTRMFLFNGQGLENFDLVNVWGGEVKLFRVDFGDGQ